MASSALDLMVRSADLVSVPAIYAHLQEALDDPDVPTSRIADIISEDAALTARLLRLVNSAFSGFPSPVETVSRAVLLVGTRQIRDLTLATSVVGAFRRLGPHLDLDAFWLHGIATGAAARVLAAHRREPNVERFFVAGVLHEVGRLLIHARRPNEARAIAARCERTGELPLVVEREVLSFDHAAAGAALLSAWRLPVSLEEMIACHHDPGTALECRLEASVLHVADVLAHALRWGSALGAGVPPLDPGAWDSLGLAPSALGPILDEVERQAREAIQVICPGGE